MSKQILCLAAEYYRSCELCKFSMFQIVVMGIHCIWRTGAVVSQEVPLSMLTMHYLHSICHISPKRTLYCRIYVAGILEPMLIMFQVMETSCLSFDDLLRKFDDCMILVLCPSLELVINYITKQNRDQSMEHRYPTHFCILESTCRTCVSYLHHTSYSILTSPPP